jgi:hypothetical protein
MLPVMHMCVAVWVEQLSVIERRRVCDDRAADGKLLHCMAICFRPSQHACLGLPEHCDNSRYLISASCK